AVVEEGVSGGVHLVWATRDDYPNFKTYYSRQRTSDLQWVESQNVTSHTSAPWGGEPKVAISPSRVHVSFNTNYFDVTYTSGNVKTRDRLNGVWQTPQTPDTGSEGSIEENLAIRGNTFYLFYARENLGSPITNDLYYRTRSVSGTSWSSPILLAYTLNQFGNAFRVCKTEDDKIHLISDGGVYN